MERGQAGVAVSVNLIERQRFASKLPAGRFVGAMWALIAVRAGAESPIG